MHETIRVNAERRVCGWLLLLCLGLPLSVAAAATRSTKMPVTPKWGRFEQRFKSAISYTNPIQEAGLTVLFISPLGETNRVPGFWDGGKVWRVRFSPSLPGRWTYQTICSDPGNRGLHNQTGRFLCTSALKIDAFTEHGQVRVARDHRHFEYADGKPFFWLADTVWDGPRVAREKDWDLYARVRAAQGFTVAQWVVSPGSDMQKESTVTGTPERIAINLDFFHRLEARQARLRHAGILSAIVPLAELAADQGAASLSDDQALLLVRYVVARWGADPVAWLLAVDAGSDGKNARRWQRIGREVFGQRPHAPVVLYSPNSPSFPNEFLNEPWLDAFGCTALTETSDEASRQLFNGLLATEPARPLLAFLPCENALHQQTQQRFTAVEVRHAAYWSLLLGPAAGVSYGGQGVVSWDESRAARSGQDSAAELPLWQRSLFMPGAKQMGSLARFLDSIDFWRVRAQTNVLAVQPGSASPGRHIVAATTETKDLGLVYVPADGTVELNLQALPPAAVNSWFKPDTGEISPAVAVVGTQTYQFPTPAPGDWLLVMKAGKP